MNDNPSGSANGSLSQDNIDNFRKNKKGLFSRFFSFFSRTPQETEVKFEDQIVEMIKSHDAENKLSSIEGRMLIHNILEFGSLTVKDVMIPRTDIVAIDSSTSLDKTIDTFMKSSLTRLPVYEDNLDNVLGFVHIKDLLPASLKHAEYNLKEIIRPLIFTVSNMNIVDMLVKMRSARVHMSVVLDEYGGIKGLVTIEDLLEEIVGSIEDEHDASKDTEATIVKITDNIYEITARASIEEVENIIGINIYDGQEEDCETIAGLVFLLSGSIPKPGEILEHPSGIKFEIISADNRNVKKVRIIL